MIRRASRRGATGIAGRLRDEGGQILPLVLFFFVIIIAGGLILFWLGVSTSRASGAQTAADAAALAGENTLVHEVDNPVNSLRTTGFSLSSVCASATQYAERNQAHVTYCNAVSSNGTVPYDVEVVVQSNQKLAATAEDPDPGASATAKARASTDAAAQASPVVEDDDSCSGGPVTQGTPFSPHGGTVGFFAAGGTDYSHGCESRLAGALDELGRTLHLHLTGTSGYVSGGGTAGAGATTTTGNQAAVSSLHACGALSTTTGLSSVSNAELARYDLVRPFPADRSEIQLADQGCNAVDASDTQTVSSGNLNVHLVPWGGGPTGSFLAVVGAGGSTSIGESELQVGCQIYSAWQQLNLGPNANEALRIAFLVAADESDFGQNIGSNTTDPDASIGVFQQISDDGWGTVAEELSVSTSAALFFEGGTSPNGQSATGLMSNLNADPGLPLYELAQETQGSGAGEGSDGAGNYGQHYAQEQSMYSEVTGGACKNVNNAS